MSILNEHLRGHFSSSKPNLSMTLILVLLISSISIIRCEEEASSSTEASSSVAPEYENTCTPGKCTQCNFDKEGAKLYCTECLGSTLGGTETDLKDGFCEGTSTGIDNCLLTSRVESTLQCVRCALGFQLTPVGQCTVTTITDCQVTNDNKDYVNCLACGNNKHPKKPLFDACETDANSVVIENCVAKDTFDTCYLCNEGYGTSDDRKECVQNGGGKGHTCDSEKGASGEVDGLDLCRKCNFFQGYTTSKVHSTVIFSGNNAQMCKKKEQIETITLHVVSYATSLSLVYLLIFAILESLNLF